MLDLRLEREFVKYSTSEPIGIVNLYGLYKEIGGDGRCEIWPLGFGTEMCGLNPKTGVVTVIVDIHTLHVVIRDYYLFGLEYHLS